MNSIVDLCHTKCKHTPSRSHEAWVVQQHLSIKLPGITTACPSVGRNDRLAFLHGIKWCKLNCGHGTFFCANAWASHHQPGFNLMPPRDLIARFRCPCVCSCGGGYQEIRPRHIPCDRLLAGSWRSIPLNHPPGIGGGCGWFSFCQQVGTAQPGKAHPSSSEHAYELTVIHYHIYLIN